MSRALSVVVPAFREAACIVDTARRILAFAAARSLEVEVLVCDDGSDDGTAATLLAAALPHVTVLPAPHAGKGAAVRRGVMAAHHGLVLVTDADLSVPLEHFDALAPHAGRAEVVIGSKYMPGQRAAYPWARRVGSLLGRLVVQACVVSGVHDTQCGFKLFRRDAARALFAAQRLDGFGHDFEVLFLARRFGFAIVEAPVTVVHRRDSRVRLGSYFRTLRDVGRFLGHRMRGRYPRAPVA